MINYVNNAFDKALKPCDAQRFNILIRSLDTEKLILACRGGDSRAKPKLAALTYMGVLDTERYKQYLRDCEAQGQRALGSRRAEFMRPTGLLMLDFDHIGEGGPTPSLPVKEGEQPSRSIATPAELWEYIKGKLSASVTARVCALAHVTPSGHGLRLVLQRTKGKTIEQEQYDFCRAMDFDSVGIRPDTVCKDISRLSFAPMAREVLYLNPDLLFAPLPDAADYPDGSFFSGNGASPNPSQGGEPCTAMAESPGTAMAESPLLGRGRGGASYPREYNGMDYASIVARLEEQLGGRPERGARNAFVFTMACNLRYVCNDDADWVAAILPTYGEEPQKHRVTIQSAVARPMSRTMPEPLQRALRMEAVRRESERAISKEVPPAMPALLPRPIELLTSRAPQEARPSVAMAVFPALGAHLHEVRFRYWDGRDYTPTFMHVVAAEMSSGKSSVNAPLDYIMADIEARDEVARKREQQWREACASLPASAEKPERPKGAFAQILSADMTNAAFVQRLVDAEGHFLYTQMDEIELLDSLKTNTHGGAVGAVLRLAFDCGKYGQERVASNAVSAKVRVRWNWNASSTVQRVRKYFAKGIADGTLSRISFSTIVRDGDNWRKLPKYLPYGDPFAKELSPYIDALCTCEGDIHSPEVEAWAEALVGRMMDIAEEQDDRAYALFSYRAVLMGFFRAMVLYVMNGMQWDGTIADFCAWTVQYDMWCKMRFFSDMMHRDIEGERTALQRGPVSLLELLPREFTREQAVHLRLAQGLSADARGILSVWKRRGLVTYDEERKVYINNKKCKQ